MSMQYFSIFMTKISQSILVFNPSFPSTALVLPKFLLHFFNFVISLIRKFEGLPALPKMTLALIYIEDLII